jgi:hypothetical protein
VVLIAAIRLDLRLKTALWAWLFAVFEGKRRANGTRGRGFASSLMIGVRSFIGLRSFWAGESLRSFFYSHCALGAGNYLQRELEDRFAPSVSMGTDGLGWRDATFPAKDAGKMGHLGCGKLRV